MEKNIKIKLSDKFYLYGKFDGRSDRPLFIIAHGLLGNMDEDFYYSAARWFKKQGFSTFRFNFYGPQKDARQLMNCTLKTHAGDIDAIIRYFRARGVKKIFIAGHSFGGLAILHSQEQDFDGVTLWDPTYNISFTKASSKSFPAGKYIKKLDGYLMRWGVNFIIGKSMAEEVDRLKWNSMAKKFKVPLQIIVAGNGKLGAAKNYLNGVGVKNSFIIIKGATHYFDDSEKIRKAVFSISKKWFKSI